MDFARAQLQKYGWEEGKGLGRDETGRKECIKAKLKMDKTGIGHDVSKEYTNHWWDNVFNKTASSIKVTSTQDGVEIKKSAKCEKEISKDLQTYSKKAMKYGNFVKKATLSNGCEKEEENISEKREVESTSLEQKYCLLPGQEDEIFSKCGGRTAHKGARHGLKLNGKLLRIQEQEQGLFDKIQSGGTNQNGHDFVKEQILLTGTQSGGTYKNDCDVIDDNQITDKSSGKKRKKKKKKSKDAKATLDTEFSGKLENENSSREHKKLKVCDNLGTNHDEFVKFDDCKSDGKWNASEDEGRTVSENNISVENDIQLVSKKKKKKKKKEKQIE